MRLISSHNRWQPYAMLYDPDNSPEADLGPAVGAIPMEIKKLEFLQYRKTLLRRNPHCFYCGRHVGRSTSNLDHVVPQSRGGRHSPSNLVLSCLDCNRDKAADSPSEWLERTRAKLKALRRLSASLAAKIEEHNLAELPIGPRPVEVPKPVISVPVTQEREGEGPTVDRSAFDLGRPMFSLVRTTDRKRLVSRLRGTDVAHYLDSVELERDSDISLICEQSWHPKQAVSE